MHEVVLDGPGRNALGTPMIDHLLDGLARAAGGPLLLRGAGGAFCAGLDIRELATMDEPTLGHFLDRLDTLAGQLYLHPGPTVACVEGHAIAAGAVLALCCDHVVATTDERARMGLNEVALGLRLPVVTRRIVSRRLAARHLDTVILGAGLHPPEEALRLGLVDELSDSPVQRARAVLAELARHPAQSYAWAKRDLRAAVVAAPDEERAAFRRECAPLWSSLAFKLRLAATLAG